MSGEWIKIELTTPDKAEICGIASRLDIDMDAAFGKLFRVWAWFDQYTTDGNAPSVTKALLDRQVCVTGFCEAMICVGWMMEVDGSISLTNFDRHNGKTAKSRALTQKRVSDLRNKNAPCNGVSVTETLQERNPEEEEEEEEEVKIKREGKKPTRSTKICYSFSFTEKMSSWAVDELGFTGCLKAETDKFIDYYRGKGDVRKDWEATWRNWIRKAKEYTKTPKLSYAGDQRKLLVMERK